MSISRQLSCPSPSSTFASFSLHAVRLSISRYSGWTRTKNHSALSLSQFPSPRAPCATTSSHPVEISRLKQMTPQYPANIISTLRAHTCLLVREPHGPSRLIPSCQSQICMPSLAPRRRRSGLAAPAVPLTPRPNSPNAARLYGGQQAAALGPATRSSTRCEWSKIPGRPRLCAVSGLLRPRERLQERIPYPKEACCCPRGVCELWRGLGRVSRGGCDLPRWQQLGADAEVYARVHRSRARRLGLKVCCLSKSGSLP